MELFDKVSLISCVFQLNYQIVANFAVYLEPKTLIERKFDEL